MLTVHPQYLTDPSGKRSLVVLPAKEFDAIMEQLEELDDIRMFDAAMVANEPSVDLDEAFRLIESKRRSKG
jgi:hypothetical protein